LNYKKKQVGDGVEILETCLYTEDLGEARKFYEGILGLKCIQFKDGQFAFFRTARGVLLVFNPAYSRNLQKLPPHGATGSIHVAFRADEQEIPELKKRFQEGGFVTYDALWGNGQSSFYVYDPAGNLIEFAPAGIWELPEGA
jgi:catechol 2,3-dioxygenase-like lactoylglutathione lyase family enzyme